ncbi:MAG: tyrosine-type recombinase/integrase [Planctomycetes bacterium]|nr:tyrosine-type recombinase/integrase [Planctomycetota bacterium]
MQPPDNRTGPIKGVPPPARIYQELAASHEVVVAALPAAPFHIKPAGVDAARAAAMFGDWFASLSPPTRRNYAQDLAAFAAFVGVADAREAAVRLCSASPLDARDGVFRWRTALRDKGEAPGTINRRLASLRSLYRHVVGAPLVVPSLKAVRRRKLAREGVGVVQALLAAAAGVGIKPLRDRALILCLHDSGLRRAEAASLRLQDMDIPSRVAHVQAKGKQGERIAVDLSVRAVAALQTYLVARGPLDSAAPVFASGDRARKGDGALTPDGIRALLLALSRHAGLARAIAPHDLRRIGACALAKAGADAETLRRWGRWADYRTPAVYVQEVEGKARLGVDLLASLSEAAG